MRTNYRVCPTCHGSGKIVNPAVSVWTSSDRDEDPDGFASMLDGDYDVLCTMCAGQRVVTRQDIRAYAENEADRRLRLQEDGIYPGSRDWY